MATAPIVVYRPVLKLQPLTEAGASDGALVDVTDDMSAVELGVDAPLITVPTFSGKYSSPDDIEESVNFEVTVNAGTVARWSPLVGKLVDAFIYDVTPVPTVTKGRKVRTRILLNPGIYGPTQPGEARTVSWDLPLIASPVEITAP